MASDRKRPALRSLSRALVKAVARLSPDEGAARLAVFHAAEPPGLRRRALLAARISLIRKAMEAPPLPAALPVLELPPEPILPEPEPPPPPPAPKPLSKGVMMSINLDDVARMLMDTPEPEPEIVPEAAPDAPPEAAGEEPPALPDVAAAFAALDWGDVAAQLAVPEGADAADWAEVMPDGGLKAEEETVNEGAAEGGAASQSAGAIDLSASFAALGALGPVPDDPAPPAPPALPAEMAAMLASLGEEVVSITPATPEEDAPPTMPQPAKARRGKAAAMDLAASFDVLGALGDGPAEAVPPAAAPAGIDLAAQFAEMGEGPAAVAAPVPDPVAGAGGKAKRAKAAKAAPITVDLSAQFAAMGGDDSAG